MAKDTLIKIDDALFDVTGYLGELAGQFAPLKSSEYKDAYEHISALQVELVRNVRALKEIVEKP
ncbi:hypothetical protein [Pseudoalteromonas sp. Angola-7]|jgi:cytochrome b involved in lipid metabolism|uniref:hypothetical protein n=1 Tax=Pseudoalteromonas sp. Angola-7 TaxID=3025336 RepID=UPI002359A25C|nr:hypothetical protein [Pseudoalteromonas sp. Angola-7]MCP4058125.1 hypothetical protein [Pseudoalteromonas sp.]MDC9530308.1 hypothetical protein [Pseudoalteromonas sp. Angola-7]|tara:strand:- start:128 stop:319 length:192 start_codon:yes stop_codon:yes gene_type:complete